MTRLESRLLTSLWHTSFPGARRCFATARDNSRPVRGMKDRLGAENAVYQHIYRTGSTVAELYDFEHISTPILEHAEVFERTLGDDSDIVGKELYKFVDKNGSTLTMRPEGTAGIARALISNKLVNTLPQKYYYYGPMFRHERPQKGRLRQFEQFGVELFGVSHPSSDLEVIEFAWEFLKRLDLGNMVELEINTLGDIESRKRYRAALTEYFSSHSTQLSEDSARRLTTNPLRILDSKHPSDAPLIAQCPLLTDYLTEASRDRLAFLTEALPATGMRVKANPRLVRGIDYYEETVFEFVYSANEESQSSEEARLGKAQGTVLAGGRYDGLVGMMGGPQHVPGIGWAAGVDRLVALTTYTPPKREKIAVIPVVETRLHPDICARIYTKSVEVASALRSRGKRVMLYHPTTANVEKRTSERRVLSGWKTNLRTLLPKLGKDASHAILVGEEEIEKELVTVRDLERMEQFRVNPEDVLSVLRKNEE
ncbi:uncharacterized protein VTP21DRAFT_4819 [Calcarisporiella thermophila]|uniref:uncharacterized protein n=1 Tax=Calcarisporiella thermophila TaxID=911321 RepID=UPI003744726E